MSRTFRDSLTSDLDTFFNVNEFARSFTLSRGPLSTTGVRGIVRTRKYETPTRDGVLTDVRNLDIDIPASEYEINDEAVDPLPGDRLTDEETNEVHQVLPLPGRQCFEPGGDGMVLQVHVKRVERPS